LNIRRIIFTDEAHFHIDGYVNRQNYRIWGTEKPAIRSNPLHPRNITVLAGICAKGIIGPIFLEQNGSVDEAVYNRMLNAALQEASETHIVGNYYWQQDGAPCENVRIKLRLRETEVYLMRGDIATLTPVGHLLYTGRMQQLECSANEPRALVFILGCGLSGFFPKVLSKLCACAVSNERHVSSSGSHVTSCLTA